MGSELKLPRVRAVWGALLHWRHRLFHAHRYRLPRIEHTETMTLLMLPEVFNGVLLRSGGFFARVLDRDLIPTGARVLDLGTGSGIVAIRAAQLGASVIAVDTNPDAVRCARINVLLNRVEDSVEVREGDLFAPVVAERFDRIMFNPPFFRQAPRNGPDAAWRATDVFDRFLAGLDGMLTPRGCALVLLSSHGDLLPALKKAGAGGWKVTAAANRDMLNEVFTLYFLEREVPLSIKLEREQGES